MTDREFIKAVYRLAFGDNPVNLNSTHEDVIADLKEFIDDALKWEAIPYVDKMRLDFDYEPTDQEVMSNFGVKWHDAL